MVSRRRTASLALIESLTAERDALAQEVAALRERERRCQDEAALLRDRLDEQRWQRWQVFEALIEGTPDGVVITTIDGVITYANRAFQMMTERGAEVIGMHLNDMIAPEEHRFVPAVVQRLLQEGTWQGSRTYLRRNGSTFEANISLTLIRDSNGQPQLRAAIIRDLTRQRRLEQEQLLLQQQVIASQQSMLRDLSAPVLRLSPGVIMAPITGSINDQRADEIVDAVLTNIARHPAHAAIVDISAQNELENGVARLLLRLSQALRLIGVRVVITGVQALDAEALASLGMPQPGVSLHATLQEGVEVVLRQS